MEANTFRSLLGLLLIHCIAVVWFAVELTQSAGFACGIALRPLIAERAAVPGATGADPQLEAAISGWEAAVIAGQWSEPAPVDPILVGSWRDLIDPGEAAEAEPEPPPCWAV